MNPIKGPAIKVQLDREREFVFSWAAIDYLTDRYESVGEAILLVEGIRNPMTMTKKSKQAVMDVFCALLLADDPDMTAEKVASIMPLDRMEEIGSKISEAVNQGVVQNPQ